MLIYETKKDDQSLNFGQLYLGYFPNCNEELLSREFKSFTRCDGKNFNEKNEELLIRSFFEQQKNQLNVFNNANALVSNIKKYFNKDAINLETQGIIPSRKEKIVDMEMGAGDFHNGKSTTLIHLVKPTKLVFKPRSGKITLSYHSLLDWVNQFLSFGNYKFKILDLKDYHWLEFIYYKSCQTQNEIENYYRRAGHLLCVTYLLNSSDFHYENVISRGDTPILIDHETIVQPKFDVRHQVYIKKYGEIKDSVLDSLLLPDKEIQVDLPIGKSGFGYHKQTHSYGIRKIGVDRFTKDWKMVNKIILDDFCKYNIPIYKAKKVYPNSHVNQILEGFESCYSLFLKNATYLKNDIKSPFKRFNNCNVRYIWRPTRVYAKILEHLKHPKYLEVGNSYRKQKLIEYLAVAYKNVPKSSRMWLIFEHEVTQMIRGDIPYFEINTSSRDLPTEHGIIEDFFELSSIENIRRKLNKLNNKDLAFQKKLIVQSVS